MNAERRFPEWIRARYKPGAALEATKKAVVDSGVATVCEEARCPNIGECWSERHATFMILGDTCTRGCRFCGVTKLRKGNPVSAEEPEKLAMGIREIGLKHVVLTSVDRDDLADNGFQHWMRCIASIRNHCPDTTLEVLVPDFRHANVQITSMAREVDVFSHNIETVPRLYTSMRAGSDYRYSLERLAEGVASGALVKTAIMVGLGESDAELLDTIRDIRGTGCQMLVVGQFLRSAGFGPKEDRFVHPDDLLQIRRFAEESGFWAVEASPMARSSYKAGEMYRRASSMRSASY